KSSARKSRNNITTDHTDHTDTGEELVIEQPFKWCVGWAIATTGLMLGSSTLAQETAPSAAPVAEMERVIVTGSNIPTAEESGPAPVDTHRPADIEKLGVRTPTDLLLSLPQEMGTTSTQSSMNLGGDGAVIPNLRRLLPKETLVLIDGKRVAIVGG